jgi:hypothetical protein
MVTSVNEQHIERRILQFLGSSKATETTTDDYHTRNLRRRVFARTKHCGMPTIGWCAHFPQPVIAIPLPCNSSQHKAMNICAKRGNIRSQCVTTRKQCHDPDI